LKQNAGERPCICFAQAYRMYHEYEYESANRAEYPVRK
jgi:hypothetical protein